MPKAATTTLATAQPTGFLSEPPETYIQHIFVELGDNGRWGRGFTRDQAHAAAGRPKHYIVWASTDPWMVVDSNGFLVFAAGTQYWEVARKVAADKYAKISAIRCPRPLTADELAAVRAYAAKHGRTWKSHLREAWMTASERGTMHALRNSHGPRWLITFRLR